MDCSNLNQTTDPPARSESAKYDDTQDPSGETDHIAVCFGHSKKHETKGISRRFKDELLSDLLGLPIQMDERPSNVFEWQKKKGFQ